MSQDINITRDQAVAAAINSPTAEFKLGDRTFPLLDLEYDDYILFVAQCAPMVDMAMSELKGGSLSLPGKIKLDSSFNVAKMILTLGSSLPKMVHMMCKQSDPDIDEAEVKALAKTPFALCHAIMLQIQKNNMIQDFSSFFAQMAAALTTKR